MAGIDSLICSTYPIQPGDVHWTTPLATIGHLYALALAGKGVKGVQRRGDLGEAVRLTKEMAAKQAGTNGDTRT